MVNGGWVCPIDPAGKDMCPSTAMRSKCRYVIVPCDEEHGPEDGFMPSSVAFRERSGELVDIDGATICLILELLKPIENELSAMPVLSDIAPPYRRPDSIES